MKKERIFNQINQFDDRKHETVMGVWWSGLLLKQIARQFFRPTALSEIQFNVLMTLKYAEKKLSQQALSDRLLVDKSNLTGVIDTLEDLKYVERCAVSGDRRRYHLKLTKLGLNVLNTLEPSYRELLERLTSEFSDEEMEQIDAYLKKVGFKDRSTFVRTCVMTVVRGELYVRND